MGTRRRGPSRRGTSRKTGKGKGRTSRQATGRGKVGGDRSAGSRKFLRGTTRQQEKKKEISSLEEFYEEFDYDAEYEEYEGGVDYE
jgi:hypothetical protein